MNNTLFKKMCLKLTLSLLLNIFVISISHPASADSPRFKNNPDGSQTLLGHVPKEVKSGSAVYKSHVNQTIDAQLILPIKNQAGLSKLLNDLYDPKSPNFHHFLTPSQFNQQFGASSIDGQTIRAFLNKQGMVVVGQQNGLVLKVAGPVSAFEKTFGMHINNYQNSDGSMFFAPDTDPTIPANMAGKIIAIGGLDNITKFHAHSYRSDSKINDGTTGLVVNNLAASIAGTGPGGFLAPNDVKTIYNMKSIPSIGAGQTIALFELDGFAMQDITGYQAQFGLPNVPIQSVLVDGFSGIPNYSAGAAEVTLDIELVAAFAPGVSKILVYEAPNTMQSWMDEWTKIANDNLASVVSCSWGMPETSSPTIAFDANIFQQMSAQGQSVFVAAGDDGAYDAGTKTLIVDEPAAQPNVTGVGISRVAITSKGAYNSESASIYGGGGVSAFQPIPSYQTAAALSAAKAANVSMSMRNVPDVVLTADALTAYSFYVNGTWGGYYGSSISAPIWASFTALVNQALGLNGPMGLLNPQIYKIAQGSNYLKDFHDVTSGSNSYLFGPQGYTGYSAQTGLDDATGLGSFNGVNLYNDLLATTKASTPPASPGNLTASSVTNAIALSWTASAGASFYTVSRATVNNGPYSVIASNVLNITYNDSSVQQGMTYYYVVSAANSAGTSVYSNQASATATQVIPPPSAPTGLTTTAGTNSITVMWNAVPGAVEYSLKMSRVKGGPYTSVALVMNNPSPQTISSLSPGIYYFVVSAFNSLYVEGPNSVEVAGVVGTLPPPPTLTATGLTLSWTPSPGAVSYNIKDKAVSAGSFYPYATVPAGTTTLNLVAGKHDFNYVVTAVGTAGESANSNVVTVKSYG